jgi:gas vesicle protein
MVVLEMLVAFLTFPLTILSNGGLFAMSESSNKITYFLAGASIGALVALLFAPKSGRELRSDISDATRRGIDYTTESAKLLGEKASHLYISGREKTSELYSLGKEKAAHLLEAGKGLFDEQRDRVAAAIEAGKQAYREKKAEVLALNQKELASKEATDSSEPAL